MKLRHLQWNTEKSLWTVSRARGLSRPADLLGAQFFIGVSLKNKEFCRSWLEGVVSDIARLNGRLTVSIVDLPYFAAAHSNLHGDALSKELHTLERLKREVTARLNWLSSSSLITIERYSWSELESGVYSALKTELHTAFRLRSRVFKLIVSQTEFATRRRMGGDPESVCEFLLREIASLVSLYYKALPGAIDVYPSANARFFWLLDTGRLAYELPLASDLAASSRPLICADVRSKR